MLDQVKPVAVETPARTPSELYPPSTDVIARAHVKDWQAMHEFGANQPAQFWADRADELGWYQRWHTVLDDTNKPFYQWFVGGQINIIHNAIDRHLHTHRKNKLAYIWQGEDGSERSMSYFSLNREVCKFANVLKALGVRKGDRVTIYMGRVLELPIAMLACAKIGAVHSVVYGGFSVEALHGRIEDSQSRVLITCDGAFLNGKVVELKSIVDDALKRTAAVETVVVFRRTSKPVNMEEGRDYWWHELMSLPVAGTKCETEPMDAEDMLFLLYTSGTTGTPKAIVHTHGGYSVGVCTPRSSTCSTSPTRTATGARRTRAGSPATATSCTGR